MNLYHWLLIVVWGILIPFVLGAIWTGKNEEQSGSAIRTLLSGVMTMLAVFQVIAVPLIVWKQPFHILCRIYVIIIVAGLLFAVVFRWNMLIRMICAMYKNLLSCDAFTKLILVAAICMVIFQTWMVAGTMHEDTDDARYAAESMEAYERDTMFQYHPITGEKLEHPVGEMRKDVIAPFPIYIALLAKLLLLHPLIVAHVVIPLLFVPYAYCIYYLLGKQFFTGKMKENAIYFFFVNLANCFAFASVYSLSFYFLLRLWHGKAMLIALMLPAVLLNLIYALHENRTKTWSVLFVTMTATAIGSSMAGIIPPILAGSMGLTESLKKKSVKPLMLCLVCCIPNIVFGVLYYMIKV